MNTDNQNDDQEIIDCLKELSDSSNKSYDNRLLKRALNALGYPIGRHRVHRLMQQADIGVRYRVLVLLFIQTVAHSMLASNIEPY